MRHFVCADCVESFTVETEGCGNFEVDLVCRVEFELQTAVDLLIEQVFDIEAEQTFGDIFENGVEEHIADRNGKQILVDEDCKSEVFVAEIDIVTRGCVVGRYECVFGGTRSRLVGVIEVFVGCFEIDDVVFKYLRDIKTADCDFLDIERFFEVEIDCVVDIVCTEPQALITGLRDIDEFEFEFGLGEVVDVDHKRYVEAEVRGRITLRSRGHFNHDTREVADDIAQNLAEIKRAFGDAEFEFDRERQRDDCVIERIGLDFVDKCHILFGNVACVEVFFTVFDVGVRLLVTDIIGQQFLACADGDIQTAEFETHIDATYCDIETEVVLADIIEQRYRAVIFTVRIFDVSELIFVNAFDLDGLTVVHNVGEVVVFGIFDKRIRFYARASVVHVQLIVSKIYLLFDFTELHKTVIVVVLVDVFAVCDARDEFVLGVGRDIGLARFVLARDDVRRYFLVHRAFVGVFLAFRKLDVVFAVRFVDSTRVRGRFDFGDFHVIVDAGIEYHAVRRVIVTPLGAIVCVEVCHFHVIRVLDCRIGGIVEFVSVAFVFVVEFGLFFGRQVGNLLEFRSAEVNAERNIEHVEHFLDRAEVGHEGRDDECEQSARQLNLELSVAVCEQYHCVSYRTCTFRTDFLNVRRNCRILTLSVVFLEFIDDFLCKINEVVDLGVVFCRVDYFREVEIESAVIEVQSAEDFLLAVCVLCKEAVFVHFDKLDCKFHLIKVAICDKRLDGTARDQAEQVKCRKVNVGGNSHTDTCVKCGLGLQIDDHIAKEVADKTACVGGFRTAGIEVDKTAYAQADVLVLIYRFFRSLIYFDVFDGCDCFVAVFIRNLDSRHRARIIFCRACGCVRTVLIYIYTLFFVVDVFAVDILFVGEGINLFDKSITLLAAYILAV